MKLLVGAAQEEETARARAGLPRVAETPRAAECARVVAAAPAVEAPCPHPWIRYVLDNGDPYWYNPETDESQWEPPAPTPPPDVSAAPPPRQWDAAPANGHGTAAPVLEIGANGYDLDGGASNDGPAAQRAAQPAPMAAKDTSE